VAVSITIDNELIITHTSAGVLKESSLTNGTQKQIYPRAPDFHY